MSDPFADSCMASAALGKAASEAAAAIIGLSTAMGPVAEYLHRTELLRLQMKLKLRGKNWRAAHLY